MGRRNAISDALVKFAKKEGLKFTIDRRKRGHPFIAAEVGQQTIRFFFPGTASDHRALANAVCGFRRLVQEARTAASASASLPHD